MNIFTFQVTASFFSDLVYSLQFEVFEREGKRILNKLTEREVVLLLVGRLYKNTTSTTT